MRRARAISVQESRRHQGLLQKAVGKTPCMAPAGAAFANAVIVVASALTFSHAGKMRNVTMARAWRRWLVCIAEQHRLVSVGRRALGSWRKGVVAKVWQVWEQRTRRRAQLAVIATKIILKWQNAQVVETPERDGKEGGNETREVPEPRACVRALAFACTQISEFHVRWWARGIAAFRGVCLPPLFCASLHAFAFAGVPLFGDLEANNIGSQSYAPCSKVKSGAQEACLRRQSVFL